MHKLVMAVILMMVVAPCAAVDIPFRDGSVIEAVDYTVNGSYLTLEMANGSKLAYDVADIDLEALREAEAAAAPPAEPVAEERNRTLGGAGTLRVPEETPAAPSAGLTITDQHVKHVRGSGIEGPEDEPEEPAAEEAADEGFEEGGNVLLNNVKVSPLEGGQWQVQGEVINRTSEAVMDIRANLQAAVPGGDPWSASVPVSGMLGPDEKSTFTHTFGTPKGAGENWAPQIQVSVVWMRGETRLEPNYNRTAPHPSSLPLDRGGVGGVDSTEEVEL